TRWRSRAGRSASSRPGRGRAWSTTAWTWSASRARRPRPCRRAWRWAAVRRSAWSGTSMRGRTPPSWSRPWPRCAPPCRAPPRSRAARAGGHRGTRAPGDPLLARGLRSGHVRRLRRRGGGGMSPRVSVIVPTYNRAHVLGESLASVLAERDVDLEVVVVDDGSTDGTAALLAGLGDRRVRPVVRPHAGIAAARNAGLAAARAPYIAFHDSDDVALPGRLAVPLAFLGAHPEVDL